MAERGVGFDERQPPNQQDRRVAVHHDVTGLNCPLAAAFTASDRRRGGSALHEDDSWAGRRPAAGMDPIRPEGQVVSPVAHPVFNGSRRHRNRWRRDRPQCLIDQTYPLVAEEDRHAEDTTVGGR